MTKFHNLSSIGLSTHDCYITEDKNSTMLRFGLGSNNKGENLKRSLREFSKCDGFFKTKIIFCHSGDWLVEVMLTPKIVDSYEVYSAISDFLKLDGSLISFSFGDLSYELNAETFEAFYRSPEIAREVKVRRWLNQLRNNRNRNLESIPRFFKDKKATISLEGHNDHQFRDIGNRSDRHIEVLAACIQFVSISQVELNYPISPSSLEKLQKAGMSFVETNEFFIKATKIIKLSEFGD